MSEETNVNTTASMKEPTDAVTNEIEKSLKKTQSAFIKEKQVTVSIPKGFKSRIGETLFLAINGSHIVLPVDGTKHKVPQSFADHLQDYLNNVTD